MKRRTTQPHNQLTGRIALHLPPTTRPAAPQTTPLPLHMSNLLRAQSEAEGGGSLQHLYAIVEGVDHDDAPLAVDQNAVGKVELPVSTAFLADGSYVATVAVPQHLHSMIIRVGYDDVACTVKRDAAGVVELTSA